MKKQTVMSLLLFQVLLIAQIRCKATIDMGTDALNIDVGVDEDDESTDDFLDSNTASNKSYEIDAATFEDSETYKLSKAGASDFLLNGNQSSTNGAEYVATLDLGSDRLGVNYRPKGYGLGANKIKVPIGDAFSMELNRKAAHSALENAGDAGIDASSVVSDDHVATKEINSDNSDDDSNINVKTKGNPHSNETIAGRADVGINESPILVNMEYYQFQHSSSDEDSEDMVLGNPMSAHPKNSYHGHTAVQYSNQNNDKHTYGNSNSVGSRKGISYVPVLYQKKNYSNEIVYEPVYPSPRGFYVPTVYPQYITRMNNARSQPVNYPNASKPVVKENLGI